MNLLQEKMPVGVKRFTLNDRYPDIDYSQFYVVLEFECYVRNDFDLDEYMAENDPGENEDRKLIEPDADDEDWLDYFYRYFSPSDVKDRIERDTKAWRDELLETYAEQYQKDHPENKDIFPIILRKMENLYGAELTPHEYLIRNFSSLRKVAKFYNAYPDGGWADDVDGQSDNESAFYTEEENESFEPDHNDIQREVLRKVSEHDFFSDKGVSIHSPRYKNPSLWYIEIDGSLEFIASDERIGIEIVTPWIRGNQIHKAIVEFRDEFFEDMDGETDDETGGHVNIRFKNKVSFNWLKLILLTQDRIDLMKFDRLDSKYAKQMLPVLRKVMGKNSLPKQLDTQSIPIFEKWMQSNFNAHKFHSINLEKFFNDRDVNGSPTQREGFVEFRIPGDDYLGSRFNQYRRSIYRYMNLMAIAADETAFRQEYHIRLNRLYQQMIKTLDSENINASMSDYAKVVYRLSTQYTFSTLVKEIFHVISKLKKTDYRKLEHSSEDSAYIFSTNIKNIHGFVSNSLFHVSHLRDYNVWLSAILHKISQIPKTNNEFSVELIKKILEKNSAPGYNAIQLKTTLDTFIQHFPEKRLVIAPEIIDLLKS